MKNACPVCGQQLEKHEGTYTYKWPEGSAQKESLFENVAWESCRHCDDEFLSGDLVQRIEQQRYIIEGLLTPIAIKAIRERLGLTQVAMAKRLGVGDKTYARWENGMCMQNRSMDNLIRIAAQEPDVFLRIDASRDPDRQQAVEQYVAQLGSSKAQSRVALAAHGAQPCAANAETIRTKLRAMLASRGTGE